MAKSVIWSERAIADRKSILNYWYKRNKSMEYPRKINGLFKEAVILISQYPNIGRPTQHKSARVKVVRDYLIVYDETNEFIEILSIWDTRQDPEKLEEVIGR